jgi:hypothetical protein
MSSRQRRRFKKERRRAAGLRQRVRRRARLRCLIDAARSRPCTDCGAFEGTERMEFDHVPERGPKRCAVCEATTKLTLLAEIAKCDVVCCSCHEKRERARGRTHGGGDNPCPNEGLAPPKPAAFVARFSPNA